MNTPIPSWLLAPLPTQWRKRLEIACGVVGAAASIAALSMSMPVDPARIPKSSQLDMRPSTTDTLRRELERKMDSTPKLPTELVTAIATGDLPAMNRLYVKGMDLDGTISLGCHSGDKKVIAWLLDHGADIHDRDARTATEELPVLVADPYSDVVAFLLEKGAQDSTLDRAVVAGAPNAVRRRIAARDQPDADDEGPLYLAVSSASGALATRLDIVDQLLAAGADPNRHGDSSVDVLDGALVACADQEDCMAMTLRLVKAGARTTGDALSAAISKEDPIRDALLPILLKRLEKGATSIALSRSFAIPGPVVKLVASKGVDWAWHDGESDEAIPLRDAIERGDREAVEAMIKAGAPVTRAWKNAASPLERAIEAVGSEGAEPHIAELIIERGASVNTRLPDGRTPLFAAAETGNLRLVTYMLDHGARPNDVVLDETAVDAAVERGNVPAARLIHSRGGRPLRPTGSSM